MGCRGPGRHSGRSRFNIPIAGPAPDPGVLPGLRALSGVGCGGVGAAIAAALAGARQPTFTPEPKFSEINVDAASSAAERADVPLKMN